MLVRARLGDVVADGVGLAGVGDTAGTALALRHHSKLAVHRRARQRPAVHLPLLWRQRETILRWIDGGEKERKFQIISANALLHFSGLNKLFMQIHIFLLTPCICMLEGASPLDEKKKSC